MLFYTLIGKILLLDYCNTEEEGAVIWTKSEDIWIHLNEAILVQQTEGLSELIHSVLSSCGIKLVYAPKTIHRAIEYTNCSATYLTHSRARKLLRSNLKCYSSLDHSGKIKLLE